jgi:dTDP-4-amino-4,6-dideoxygalactose transaminase
MASKIKIPLFKVLMAEDVIEPMSRTLMSGYVGCGPKVADFERLIANYIGLFDRVNAVNSGTSGLVLALGVVKKFLTHSPGLQQKDEILTTPLTCFATNSSILAAGFKLKWVDVTPDMTVDLDDLRRKISHRTAGIMLVHWGGLPNPIDKIQDITREWMRSGSIFQPYIIEDCAHALGSTYNDRMIGHHGNIAVFSFGAIKHLTTGDGGAVACSHPDHHEMVKLARWYGLSRDPDAPPHYEQNVFDWSSKYTMNDVAATIGINNFAAAKDSIAKSRDNANYYNTNLYGVNGIRKIDPVPGADPSYWLYTIKVERRDEFIKKMASHGVEVGFVHSRNDTHSCFYEFKGMLPTTDYMAKHICCLPCGWWVTPEDRAYIVDCIKKGW